jgi:ATP-dependent RNA helicase DeaD
MTDNALPAYEPTQHTNQLNPPPEVAPPEAAAPEAVPHNAAAPAEIAPDSGEPVPAAETEDPNVAPTILVGKPNEVFDSDLTFSNLGLRASVLKGIETMGFTRPTSIQASLIPLALTGRDVLGQAKTGTGKTAAFGLPLLNMCNRDQQFQALVLAPTRELAIQITDEINELGKFTPIRAVTVYGGQAIQAQARNLERNSQIIVATPGRLMDLKQRGMIHFDNVRFVVLDEVDRMFDIGFRDDIRRILEMCPPPGNPGEPGKRQTIVVSATINGEIEKLARRHMANPEKIVTAAGSLTVSLVEQHHLTVAPWDKKRLLVHLLTHEEPGLTVVFCRLKRTVDELAKILNHKGITAYAIHGDMSQGKRNSTMRRLKEGELSVLIASDLASRGIDADGVSHVINYDLPEDPDLYVHRIGRTARAGRRGVAWSLVTPEQGELLTEIELLINAEIPKLHYPDFEASPRPDGWRDAPKGGRPEGGLKIAGIHDQPDAPPPPPKMNRVEMAVKLALPPVDTSTVDQNKFPGGIVPTKLPPKRLFGRMPTGRR